MDRFENEIERATKRAADRLAQDPRAVAAHYDLKRGEIVIELSTGYTVSFAPERAEGLANVKPFELAEIEITPSGYGLHFPKLDADLWMPALLDGVFGSRGWMAARLGARGGKVTSAAKVAAARANGKRGGRPRSAPEDARDDEVRRIPWSMRPAPGTKLTLHPLTAPARKTVRAPARKSVTAPARKTVTTKPKKSQAALKSKGKAARRKVSAKKRPQRTKVRA
jgi:hypothetical protein